MEPDAKPDAQPPTRLLHLHPQDNVAIVLQEIVAGETYCVGSALFVAAATLTLGHKVACADIAENESVLKYGSPIGLAGSNIRMGDHVHLHNLVSQYTVIEDMKQ